jgi:hypothetical protein
MFDNYQNQSQFNTVVLSQIKVDWVGLFEPTTSANFVKPYPPIYQKVVAAIEEKEECAVQTHQPATLFSFSSSIIQLLVKDLRTEDCFIPSLLSSCSDSTSFS